MDVTPKYFILTRVVPITILSFIFCLILMFGFSQIFSSIYVRVVLWAVPAFVGLVVLAYPLTIYQQRRNAIEEQMTMFITRVGVLTTSSVSRKSVFDILSYAKEFDELAIEINKINKLIDNWKISTPEACRIIARQTPSEMFADFLDRMAIAIESALNPKDFFSNEQEIVLQEYEAKYKVLVDRLEMFKELYISLISVALFLMMFVALMPIITSVSSYMLMFLFVFLFLVINVVFVYFVSQVMPRESIWHQTDMVTKMDKRARIAIVIGLVASTLLAAILGIALYRFLPPLFIASFSVIPMFFSGLYIQLQENKIKRKDDVYAAFVSSLGHSSETKSLEASKALDKLRHHDFGDLTININDLYTRLKTRIDSELSWKYFGSETGSNLISRFSHFYVEGAKQGGNGKQIANIISMTFTKMKSLRKMRYFSSESFTAIASFLVFMTAFVGYMSYFIMEKLLNIAKDIGTTNEELQQFEQVAMFNPNVSLDAFQAVVLLSLLINVVSAAAISRFTSGGHKGVALMHIAFFTWVSAGAYFMVYVLLKLLIGI